MKYFWITDGNGCCSGIITAETGEEASEIWNDMFNPYGFEVIGHPYQDGQPHEREVYEGWEKDHLNCE